MQNGNPGCRFLCLLPLPAGEGWGEGIRPHHATSYPSWNHKNENNRTKAKIFILPGINNPKLNAITIVITLSFYFFYQIPLLP